MQKIADLGDGKTWHPFGYAYFVDLLEDPNAPAELYNNIYLRSGAKGLVEFWQEQEAQGVSHITVNLKPSQRPTAEVMQDFVENVVSRFKSEPAASRNTATLSYEGSFSDEELAHAGGFGEQFRQSFVEAEK